MSIVEKNKTKNLDLGDKIINNEFSDLIQYMEDLRKGTTEDIDEIINLKA